MDTLGIEPNTSRMLSERDNQLHHVPLKKAEMFVVIPKWSSHNRQILIRSNAIVALDLYLSELQQRRYGIGECTILSTAFSALTWLVWTSVLYGTVSVMSSRLGSFKISNAEVNTLGPRIYVKSARDAVTEAATMLTCCRGSHNDSGS
jgi:hypothetical protein